MSRLSYPCRVLILIAYILLLPAAVASATLPTDQASTPRAAIHAIPGADGTSILVAAGRLGSITTPIQSSVYIGGTCHEPSHSDYDPLTDEYGYTFEGVADPYTSPAMTVVVTTTAGMTGTQTLGTSDFVRHYLAGDVATEVTSWDNNARLFVPAGALTPDSYLIIMNTVAPPGDIPPGHRLLSQATSIRASGSVTESLAPLSLQINYEPLLLGDTDRHTLSMFLWHEDADPARRQWLDVGSEPFGFQPTHVKSVQRFGTYALMASTTWRDPFLDYDGLAERENVRLTGGQLTLREGYTQGYATSVPISPTTRFAGWGTLRYTAEIAAGTSLTVDVLAADGSPLLEDLPDGASLAAIDPVAHPRLRLRANLSTQQTGVPPYLDTWAINWTPETPTPLERQLYLPLLTVGAGEQGSKGAREQGSGGESPSAPLPPSTTASQHPTNWFGCDPPPLPPITWTVPVALTGGNGIAIAPSVAADHEGRLHAAWVSSYNVFYTSKEPGQSSWSTPVSVPSLGGLAFYPSIGVDSRGTVHLIWNETLLGQDQDNVIYVSKPRGGEWGTPVNLSNTLEVNVRPQLHVDGADNLHVVWSDGSPGNDEILYVFKPNDQPSWATPERVSHTPATSWAPDVVADSQGGVHAVWYEGGEIYHAYRSPDTHHWSEAANVSLSAGGSLWPALGIDAEDTVHLVWHDTLPQGIYGSVFILYYAAKPAAGDWTERLELSRTPGGGQNIQPPSLAVGPMGAVHVAWATFTEWALRYVTRPDPEMGWSTPQVVAALTPSATPDNQMYFLGLATDPDRGVHLLWNDMVSPIRFEQDILHSIARPPPIPDDHVLVVDGSGRAVRGACVYQNGQLVGTTDALGVYAPHSLAIGDHLVALKPLAEQEGTRRDDWAYRTALTNLAVDSGDPASQVFGHKVTQSGRQTLALRPDLPLVYFNLIVSIQWNTTPTYTQEISRTVRQASDYLYDVSDGQMAFGRVAIYEEGEHWEEADVQILTRNNVCPYAYIGGLVSPNAAHVIRVGRHWNRYALPGPWDAPDGFRTLVHEFGHYALHLYDSYFMYVFDDAGHLSHPVNTGCTEQPLDPVTDATNATIMHWQYDATELAAQDVLGLWTSKCQETVQWQLNGESDWETLLRHYADDTEPPRWRFTTPLDRGSVLAGPPELPSHLLPFPEIEIHERGLPSPPRQLTVLDTHGLPYRDGALVALDTQRDGRTVTLDQGITNRYGQIVIYGASTGNTLRAVSIDGGVSAQTMVGANMVYTLTLSSSGGLLAASAPVNPYASLIPSDDGRDLTLVVGGVDAGGALSALVVPPGASPAQTIELGYSPGSGGYQGAASFAVGATGLGSVHVRGLGSLGQTIAVDGDFHLTGIDVASEQDLYTPDGAAWLHLDADSFGPDNVYIALMPTGAVPQPLPDGMAVVGNAYSLRASGSITETARPGVLRLFYDPARLDAGADPADLHIARWDRNTGWHLLPGQPDPERFAVSARTTHLGIYALLAPAEGGERQAHYLPLVQGQ